MISCKADIMSCLSKFHEFSAEASSQPFYYARHTPQNYSPAGLNTSLAGQTLRPKAGGSGLSQQHDPFVSYRAQIELQIGY